MSIELDQKQPGTVVCNEPEDPSNNRDDKDKENGGQRIIPNASRMKRSVKTRLSVLAPVASNPSLSSRSA